MAGEGVPPMSAFGRSSCEMWLLIINFNKPLIMMVRMMKVKVVSMVRCPGAGGRR